MAISSSNEKRVATTMMANDIRNKRTCSVICFFESDFLNTEKWITIGRIEDNATNEKPPSTR